MLNECICSSSEMARVSSSFTVNELRNIDDLKLKAHTLREGLQMKCFKCHSITRNTMNTFIGIEFDKDVCVRDAAAAQQQIYE